MVCLVKSLGAATRKISAKKNRPKTTTAPCQMLIASTSFEIATEFVAMYFLLFLVESAYEQPRKLSSGVSLVSIDAHHIDIDTFCWTVRAGQARTRLTRYPKTGIIT